MLPAEKLDLSFATDPLGLAAMASRFARPQRHPTSRLKDGIVCKQLFYPDFAFQTLGFGDPTDG